MNTKATLPRLPITDPAFRYVKAAQSDIRQTFERVRRENADAKKVRQILKGAKT